MVLLTVLDFGTTDEEGRRVGLVGYFRGIPIVVVVPRAILDDKLPILSFAFSFSLSFYL